jgi:hypothetical protein
LYFLFAVRYACTAPVLLGIFVTAFFFLPQPISALSDALLSKLSARASSVYESTRLPETSSELNFVRGFTLRLSPGNTDLASVMLSRDGRSASIRGEQATKGR